MQRDQKYDVLKGIAIIMMVAFHARAPHCLSHFGHLFHVPVFFVLAGWFFKFECADSVANCIHYTKKRFARLWFPVFFWGLIFILLHNNLLDWHLISTLGIDEPIPANYHAPHWTRYDYIHNILGAPLFQSDYSQLAGAFWFLQSLLFASIGYCITSYAFKVMRLNVIAMQTVLSLALMSTAKHFNLPFVGYIGGAHTLTAYALIHLGVLLRHFNFQIEKLSKSKTIALILMCFFALIGLASIGNISLALNEFKSCTYLLLCSTIGWYFLVGLSSLIVGSMRTVLAYIGENTMPIVILHLVSLKAINAIGILTCKLPSYRLADFPVAFSGGGWWIAYTVAGVGIPLALNFVYLYGQPLKKRI